MSKKTILITAWCVLWIAGCNNQPTPPADGGTTDNGSADGGGTDVPADGGGGTVTTARIQPTDLEYLGAFRLPDADGAAADADTWTYASQALAYCPDGDPTGADDGYPGSLFGTGHDITNRVSEVSIPAPSLSRNVADLPMATTLQGFQDIRAGLFDPFNEMPRVGLTYLPAQGEQTSGKLYMTWGQHFHEEAATTIPTHAWCETNLAAPDTQGAWWIDDESLYSVNGYLLTIPETWAAAYTGNRTLGTGRFRDGGWSGMGPSLYAFAPWLEGNPPAVGTRLQTRTLLRYSNTRGEDATNFRLTGYQHSDEWEGAAWLTASGDRAAVVFVGTKGSGYVWYGFYSPAGDGMPCVEQGLTMVGCYNADGTECPAEMQGECPGHVAASRGWWSSRFDGQFIFYDPADFAAVLAGTMQPYEPQPYATLDVDDRLFLNATTDTESLGTGDQRRYRLGEPAYDRQRGVLYVPELFADGAKPVIHVWWVN